MAILAGCNLKESENSSTSSSTKTFNDATLEKCAIQPNSILKSFMVIQRNKPVPIWGTATADQEDKEITVTFKNQVKVTTVKNGKWSVTLDPMEADKQNNDLFIACEDINIKFTNILVGEVWLASGQSNMCFYIEYLQGETKDNIMADCDYNDIRMFVTPETISPTPEDTIENTKWIKTTSLSINQSHFSTVAFLFARKLRNELDVPIGIICSAVGGTRVETWIDPDVLSQSQIDVYGGVNNESAYNGMIHPLIPFAFNGMIWYQGEGNCFPADHVEDYSDMVKVMVENIRERFNNPEMPFIQVQLPTYGLADADYTKMRFQQMLCDEKIKHCYTTINYDTGNPKDIHPTDKLLVGQRLADMALEKVFGLNADNQYPTLDTVKAEGSAVIVTFKDCEKGIVVKDASINGLEICGTDGVYHQATATLVGNSQLKVTSNEVASPSGVRYACKSNMEPTQLFGGNLLPAKPFDVKL